MFITHLNTFAQTIDIGSFCIEQFIEDQPRSSRDELRASKSASVIYSRCFAAFRLPSFSSCCSSFSSRLESLFLPASLSISLRKRERTRRGVSQRAYWVDKANLFMIDAHYLLKKVIEARIQSIASIFDQRSKRVWAFHQHICSFDQFAYHGFLFLQNRLAVFPVTLARRTFKALTKSMYPSSLMSNSSSFDTKHSSCSSIHRKTLSVLRLNELYWRYSSISFLRCCQALSTVSSLFFKIFETSSRRKRESDWCN